MCILKVPYKTPKDTSQNNNKNLIQKPERICLFIVDLKESSLLCFLQLGQWQQSLSCGHNNKQLIAMH